jgi:hypothetical protein
MEAAAAVRGAMAAPGIGVVGILLMVLWIGILVGVLTGFVMTLIALWRGAKAHRSIAGSLQEIAEAMKRKS